jgi:hypothetical protein
MTAFFWLLTPLAHPHAPMPLTSPPVAPLVARGAEF